MRNLFKNPKAATLAKRLALFAVLEVLLFFGSFFLLFILSFSGVVLFSILVISAYLAIAISIGVFIFRPRLRRRAKFFYPILLLCLAIPVLVHAVYSYLDDQIPVFYDGVNIASYQPFSPSVPRLPEKPSLQLSDDLPVLDGALALYPVYSAFATAVYPEKDYKLFSGSAYSNSHYDGTSGDPTHTPHEVHFTNTYWGFRGLVEGRVDIYFMAEISDEQKDYAAENGVELVYTPIGKEAFVFFVNSANRVRNLTLDEVRGIYSGKITSWAELGGKGEIKAFQREKNSGSQSALENLMRGHRLMAPPVNESPGGMGGIIREVANYKNYPGAIGFSFRFFSTQMASNDQIRLLEIDGVAPSIENIENGSYPLASNFYAITRKDNTRPNVQKMLNFMTSAQGQYLVEQVGYTPIKIVEE